MSSEYRCDKASGPASVAIFRNNIDDRPFGFIYPLVLKNKIPMTVESKFNQKFIRLSDFLCVILMSNNKRIRARLHQTSASVNQTSIVSGIAALTLTVGVNERLVT